MLRGALSIQPPLADRLLLPLLDLALCWLTQTCCGSAGYPTNMVKLHVPCPSATGVATNQPGATLRWLTSPVLCLTCLQLCLSALEL